MRIGSEDFWTALEEYGEYNEMTPQSESQGIVITTGDASVVQTGGSLAGGVNISQNKTFPAISMDALASELAALRSAMTRSANDASDYVIIGAVAEAEEAATHNDNSGVARSLARAGQSALEAAREIGMQVAVAAISHSMGI